MVDPLAAVEADASIRGHQGPHAVPLHLEGPLDDTDGQGRRRGEKHWRRSADHEVWQAFGANRVAATMADDLDVLEGYLSEAPVDYAYVPALHGGGGHAGKFAVVLRGGVTAICKPASGTNDGGLAVRNEAAAWHVACLLGWPELVACTVVRELPLPATGATEPMALQVMWPGLDFIPDIGTFTDEEVWKAALFDYLILHSDRGSKQRLKLIDHGFAFNYPNRESLNSDFAAARRTFDIPQHLLEDVARFGSKAAASPLRSLLGGPPFDALVARVTGVVNRGRL